MEWYRHRQISPGLVVIFVIMATFMAMLGAIVPPFGARVALSGVLVMTVLLSAVFSSLTTVVTDEHFVFHFGLGVWRKRVPLSEIRSLRLVRSSPWHSLGIRLTPHGWLYSVWGLDAVEIELATGRRFRVGTDEAQPLANAITDRLAASGRGARG